MYAKIENGSVVVYPYSLAQFRAENPLVGLPAQVTAETLAPYGIALVVVTGAPEHDHTLNPVEGVPAFSAERNRWEQTWTLVPASAEEIAERTAAQAASVRGDRNARMAASDWTQLDDTPLTNAKKLEWATYRQALRDIPQQAGFPWQVSWPEQP